MPKLSAGLLLYRVREEVVDVLIGHPGGPFWARKDDGAWSIPKGEYTDGEDPWAVAQREFEEEIGLPPPFWAFAWAGGQALARYLIDNPGVVAGQRLIVLMRSSE